QGEARDDRGEQRWCDDAVKSTETSGTESGGSFFNFAFEVFEHRLQGADRERHSDERQGDDDPQRGERAVDTKRHEPPPEPTVACEKTGKSQPCDGRRQSERKIDECIDEALTGKIVTDQHPGKDGPEKGIGECRSQRSAKSQLVCRQRAVGGGQAPKVGRRNLQRFQEQACDGYENYRAQIKQSETHRQAESRQRVEFLLYHERRKNPRETT